MVVDRADLVEQPVVESTTCSVAFCSRAKRMLLSTGSPRRASVDDRGRAGRGRGLNFS